MYRRYKASTNASNREPNLHHNNGVQREQMDNIHHGEVKGQGQSHDPPVREKSHLQKQLLWTSNANQREIMMGNLLHPCPSTAKVVRIFTSSTFTDTRHERNALMEKVYPPLRELCQEYGFEFQVVDMRWGIRDEATDDHATTDLCLREIENCKRLSTGPYFVSFLAHKYGYRSLPREIVSSELDVLLKEVVEPETKAMLHKWYRRDDNAVPPTYILQAVSSHLPEFLSADPEVKNKAKAQWFQESDAMLAALTSAAKQRLSPPEAHCYQMSVTETEVRAGVMTSDADLARCFWFQKIVEDIDSQPPSYVLSRYKECQGEHAQEPQRLLSELRDGQLSRVIPPANHATYTVTWADGGIDPSKNAAHRKYVDKLCDDFRSTLGAHIRAALEKHQKEEHATPLMQEVTEHAQFCQAKCQSFYGRQETLKRIEEYLLSDSQRPLVIHGSSGSGKTSLVAMGAAQAWTLFSGKSTVVLRFLGTTPDSTSLPALLYSLIQQVETTRGQPDPDLPVNLQDLTEQFQRILNETTADRPLLLFLDSLDQLDPTGGARQLSWMPSSLPPNVKMVVSTLPEKKYESFPKLQSMFPEGENFIDVPTLPQSDVTGILDQWLMGKKRKLTATQREAIEVAYRKCPLPLFLKLSFDEACRWRSYSPPEVTSLAETVRDSITALFSRLERMHGQLLVARALGYLTMSRNGLTDIELEDIVSCDDEVLNDVYAYWTPPIRRLPPLLLVRVKADLEDYLVARGADGSRVFFWYHRQFLEAAEDRYCTDPEIRSKLHAGLADYFAGVWGNGREKPFTDKHGKEGKADRHIAAQPLKFGNSYNVRKLSNLPWQRMAAAQLDLLKTECLLNFEFLLAKLKACGLRALMEDVAAAHARFPDDSHVTLVCEALQLSQGSLLRHPHELASQLMARIPSSEELGEFLTQCQSSSVPYLQPSRPPLTQPGGPLLHCLGGHKDAIMGFDLTQDGTVVVTCSRDKTVKLWSVQGGKLLHSIDDVGDAYDVTLACDDTVLVVLLSSKDTLGYSRDTYTKLYSVPDEVKHMRFKVMGDKKRTVAILQVDGIRWLDAASGAPLGKVKNHVHKQGFLVTSDSTVSAGRNILAFTDRTDNLLMTFDLVQKKFLTFKRPFPKFKDKDGKEVENTVNALAVAPDDSVVYVANRTVNDLLILDPCTLTTLKTFKGFADDVSRRFHVTPSGSHVYFATFYVVTWDVTSGERSTLLPMTAEEEDDVLTVDMRTLVTYGSDRILKIWDVTRSEVIGSQSSDPDVLHFVRTVHFLPNPRYVLTVNRRTPKTGKSSPWFLSLYDLHLQQLAREAEDVNDYLGKIFVVDDSTVFFQLNDGIRIVDLLTFRETRWVALSLENRLSTAYNETTKELFAVASGGKEIAVYDVIQGQRKFSLTLTGKQKPAVDSLLVNKMATVLVAFTNEGPVLVFDLKARSLLYSFTASDIGADTEFIRRWIGDEGLISPDGKFLMLQSYGPPPGVDRKMRYNQIWNLEARKTQIHLVDDEAVANGSFVNEARFLDDQRQVISTFDDGVIRLFDLLTGAVLKKVAGHTAPARISLVEKGAFVMTWSSQSEDKAIKLWDANSLEPVASFTLDSELRHASLSPDGRHVIGVLWNDREPIIWQLQGGNSSTTNQESSPFSKYPTLPANDTVMTLQLMEDDKAETTTA